MPAKPAASRKCFDRRERRDRRRHQIHEAVYRARVIARRFAFDHLANQPDYLRLRSLNVSEDSIHRAIMPVSMPILEINEIRRILPHRYPMLLVDRIVELEAEHIVGIKNVTANEPFFAGHFPDFPVMPGVLIVEAMAQTAGVLVLKSIPDRESKLVLLVSIEFAKFRRPVVPGDQLRIEMTVIKRKASVAKMAGRATVDGLLVAEAEVMCKLADKDEAQTS